MSRKKWHHLQNIFHIFWLIHSLQFLNRTTLSMNNLFFKKVLRNIPVIIRRIKPIFDPFILAHDTWSPFSGIFYIVNESFWGRSKNYFFPLVWGIPIIKLRIKNHPCFQPENTKTTVAVINFQKLGSLMPTPWWAFPSPSGGWNHSFAQDQDRPSASVRALFQPALRNGGVSFGGREPMPLSAGMGMWKMG